jgi:hypothetical protein
VRAHSAPSRSSRGGSRFGAARLAALAPVAQGIERCPAEAEVARSNRAGRIPRSPCTRLFSRRGQRQRPSRAWPTSGPNVGRARLRRAGGPAHAAGRPPRRRSTRTVVRISRLLPKRRQPRFGDRRRTGSRVKCCGLSDASGTPPTSVRPRGHRASGRVPARSRRRRRRLPPARDRLRAGRRARPALVRAEGAVRAALRLAALCEPVLPERR